jgi:asparagine synthase (glutamine-hydrolysing)
MCGIVGILFKAQSSLSQSLLTDRMCSMVAQINHRGPDGQGVWADSQAVLGHARLAIIDTSNGGFQPMHDVEETVHVVFNGEIYNYLQLKKELQSFGYKFKSQSDTEIIIHGYKHWGADLFSKLVGMFAIAIWDSVSKKMTIARDRFGEKPLYYFDGPNEFIFASEIKAILAWPKVPRIPDKAAIHDYLTFGYTVGPYTAFSGIKRLQPAHYMILETDKKPIIERYWSLPDVSSQKLSSNTNDLKVELIQRFQSAVESCLISDVPLGAFLSGGVDSSAVVAMMAAKKGAHIKTFSSGFDLENYDETQFAGIVADRYQTEHRSFIFGDELLANIPKLVWHYGEPYSDSSALVTFGLAKKVREHVTVALTGDGADEILLGYPRYSRYKSLLESGSHGRELRDLYLGQGRVSASKRRAADTYGYMVERFREAQKLSSYGLEMFTKLQNCSYDKFIPYVEDAATAEEMAARLDVAIYLPDDLLVKTDVAMMATGLEGRSPFLNHEFAEFAASIPAPQRLLNGYEKGLLKSALEPYLPHEAMYRTKMGFRIPVAQYMRDTAYEQTKDLLLSDRFLSRGVITEQAIEAMLSEHRSNKQDHGTRLWALVGLEMWYRTWIDSDTGKELVGDDNPFAQFANVKSPSKIVSTYV